MDYLCEYCNEHADLDAPDVWQQQVVWVGGPKKHGSVLVQHLPKYAHEACIKKWQAGIDANQQELI